MELMSIKKPGRARRSFIMGMRLWPPLKSLASSPCCCNRAMASGMLVGRKYSKAGGIIDPPFDVELADGCRRKGVPYITLGKACIRGSHRRGRPWQAQGGPSAPPNFALQEHPLLH